MTTTPATTPQNHVPAQAQPPQAPRLPDPPIAVALPGVGAWTDAFRGREIPVLAGTAEALEALRANEDDVDANGIGEMIANDPLMTLKVLAHASSHRGKKVVTDTETVTAALVMMGIIAVLPRLRPAADGGRPPRRGAASARRPARRRAPRSSRREFRARLRRSPHGPGRRSGPRRGAAARVRRHAAVVPRPDAAARDRTPPAGRSRTALGRGPEAGAEHRGCRAASRADARLAPSRAADPHGRSTCMPRMPTCAASSSLRGWRGTPRGAGTTPRCRTTSRTSPRC